MHSGAGRIPDGVVVMEANGTGTERRTALACRALLHQLEPYGASP